MADVNKLGIAGDPTRVSGRRMIGYLLDSVLDLLVLLGLLAVFDARVEEQFTLGIVQPEDPDALSAVASALVVFGIYYLLTRVLMLGFLGWTPGMVLMGIRCVQWNGRPCGLVRALVRTTVAGVLGYLFGSLYWILAALVMSTSKGHKTPHDFVGGTYVIDGMYAGRMILDDERRVIAGPQTITREEMAAELRRSGVEEEFVPPSLKVKPGEPTFDKRLDTYVMWNDKANTWLKFDKSTGSWERIG